MNIGLAVAAALGTAVLLASCWLVLGWWLLRNVRGALLQSERLCLAILAGAGVMGVALFVVGQLWFSRPMVLGLVVAALLPVLSRTERQELWGNLRQIRLPGAPAAVPLAGLFALMFLAGLARPAGHIGHDGISYHLLGPAVWLRQHRVVPVLDAAPTAFPVAIEALFAAGMAIGNERVPGVIGAFLTLTLIVQVFGLARWVGAGPRWAALASLVVGFMPVVSREATGFVDMPYAGFALAALRLLFTRETEGSLAGPLFLGLSMATKYNGMTLTAVTLGLSALRGAINGRAADALRTTARAALVSALLALPFLLRNLLVLGTPIYPPPPALARLLPGKAFSLAASIDLQRYIMIERGGGFGRGLSDLLLVPWRLTFNTSNFHGAGGIGLVALAFFPAALLAGGPLGRWRWQLAWLALNTVVWFVVQQEARFFAPYFILATAIAVVGAEALVARFPRAGRVAAAMVLGSSVCYGAIILSGLRHQAASALSHRADAARWAAEVPYFKAFAYLNSLPDPCRVLILGWPAPPYFLEKDYVKVEGLYYEHPIEGVEDPLTALARLDALGVTHVLDVQHSSPRGGSLVVPLPPPPSLELVFETPTARVFRVRR
jgi:hypothetical protein